MASDFTSAVRTAIELVPSLAGEQLAVEQVVERFRNKYLVAVLKAPNTVARQRAWGSFHYYLTAPLTGRKPFSLSPEEADALLAELGRLVNEVTEAS